MSTSALIQQVVNGLGLGVTYSLVGLAFNLQFGVLRILNLAFGELLALSAFITVPVIQATGGSGPSALGAGVAAAIIAGIAVHMFAVRTLGDVADISSPRHLAALISTLGCSLFIQNALLLLAGSYPRRVPPLLPQGQFNVGGLDMPHTLLINISAAVVLMAGLTALLSWTRIGLRIRAIASNRQLARSIGIATNKDELLAVVLSSGFAGVAGVLVANTVGSISPFIGIGYGFKGLVVVIVGGLGSSVGAVVVGTLLGITEALAVSIFDSSYRDAVTFGLLLGFLVLQSFRKR
jgi:branched-chain amino acid transport system permease protein